MSRIAWWFPALPLLLTHCAGDEFGNASTERTPHGAPPRDNATGSDAGIPETGRTRDDDPDDEGTDTNGDGADGVVGRDAYVSLETGSDTNEGTPTAPFRTIRAATVTAAQRGGRVLVFAGTYALERLDIPGAWAIYGGYRDGFKGAPKRELTILSAPETGIFLEVAKEVRFAHVTVLGAPAVDSSHLSAHAIRSKVSKLVLDDVEVQAGDAHEGAAGKTGERGADGLLQGGPLVCDGITQPVYASGAVDTSYEGKPRGDFNAKRRAETGSDGYPGTDGADAVGELRVKDDVVVPDVGQPGLGDGNPGFGAPAGGNQPRYYAGHGGSGGCPGKGGAGGESGGASVAILVLSGAVELHRSHLRTGIGGVGGDGGEGGPGGHGGWGGPPWDGSDERSTVPCKVPSDDPMRANCSAWGGIGGNGGPGGRGGGGIGGATIGVVTVGAATATIDDNTVIATGRPGTGGRGNGGGRAPNGHGLSQLSIK